MTSSGTTPQAVSAPAISDSEAAAINACRTALEAIAERAQRASWDQARSSARALGMLEQLATSTEWQLFMVLNTARSHDLADLSDAQVFNHSDDAEGGR